jgi:hypothetical protein
MFLYGIHDRGPDYRGNWLKPQSTMATFRLEDDSPNSTALPHRVLNLLGVTYQAATLKALHSMQAPVNRMTALYFITP